LFIDKKYSKGLAFLVVDLDKWSKNNDDLCLCLWISR